MLGLEYHSQQEIVAEIKGTLYRAQMEFYGLICDINAAKTAPHVIYPTKITRDGNMYCCLYGDNLQEGIAGFGETPEKACAEFDRAWRGDELK